MASVYALHFTRLSNYKVLPNAFYNKSTLVLKLSFEYFVQYLPNVELLDTLCRSLLYENSRKMVSANRTDTCEQAVRFSLFLLKNQINSVSLVISLTLCKMYRILSSWSLIHLLWNSLNVSDTPTMLRSDPSLWSVSDNELKFTLSKPTVSIFCILLLQLLCVSYGNSACLVFQHTLQYVVRLWLSVCLLHMNVCDKVFFSNQHIQIMLHVIFNNSVITSLKTHNKILVNAAWWKKYFIR